MFETFVEKNQRTLHKLAGLDIWCQVFPSRGGIFQSSHSPGSSGGRGHVRGCLWIRASGQRPEGPDFVALLHVARVETPTAMREPHASLDSRFSTRATRKNCDANHVPRPVSRATAYRRCPEFGPT